ncbi:hypothetical protein FJT64_016422 [Amphibalanus amphitrite]|uniref:Reverse transcriptase zinc-binding domain-containing protein n=1 Tax=Amphibalanus amphitrite TaxID=1232801 RepID=A0A6A4XEH3_AMPAM|nr:hypothetical protein FJT64_016422 [Amphibalanus amphitrite]
MGDDVTLRVTFHCCCCCPRRAAFAAGKLPCEPLQSSRTRTSLSGRTARLTAGQNRAVQALIQFHHLNIEETVRAPAGAVCSSLRAELTAMREAFAAVAGLEDGELASTNAPIDLSSARAAVTRHVRELSRQRATAAHPHPDPTPGHDSLARWGSVTLSQLRTGTSPLTRDTLHKIGPAANDECPACVEPDSAAHLLTDCPAYEAARRRRWGVDPRLVDVLGGPATKVVTFIEDVRRAEPPLDPPPP